jgi:hypothetical protein
LFCCPDLEIDAALLTVRRYFEKSNITTKNDDSAKSQTKAKNFVKTKCSHTFYLLPTSKLAAAENKDESLAQEDR